MTFFSHHVGAHLADPGLATAILQLLQENLDEMGKVGLAGPIDGAAPVSDGVAELPSPTRRSEAPGPEEEVDRLEKRLADSNARWPARSPSPSLLQELESLEDKLREARKRG